MSPRNFISRLPIGAEILPEGGAHFRVWADRNKQVSVVLVADTEHLTREYPLESENNGYFSGQVAEAKAGNLYAFRLEGRPDLLPDPASRFQPQGPFGPSQLVDPSRFEWTDNSWQGIPREGQVIYEMHVGTFTSEGTFQAASEQFDELAKLGITVIELMPIAEFPGQFGWGYDGISLFAPTRLYGAPHDFRRFVDRAHASGIGVILDVVYNHIGPLIPTFESYSDHYFSDRYKSDWGQAINFDSAHSAPVREFFLANVTYWIDEFHLDGYRVDATQNIYDTSEDHILAAISRRVRNAAKGRQTLMIAENEPQQTRLVRPSEQGGYGYDALWNDDFHHSAMVALFGHNEAYYTDYRGAPQEFISAAKYGYLYQGQRYQWQKKRRGTPTFDLPPTAFVNFIQNHDQIANSAHGLRCHVISSPGAYKAMTALLLLGPGTPMLFQGQEFASSARFYYFADHTPETAKLIREGRAKFLAQFPSIATPETQAILPDPFDPKTFQQCKLDFSERSVHGAIYALHRDLLHLRHNDPVFRSPQTTRVDGAVLSPEAFVLRFFGAEGENRLLLINFGCDLNLNPAPEPLLAPPAQKCWKLLWSSEDAAYESAGTPPLETDEGWQIPGRAAVVMKSSDLE